jgi:hypothetical protein
MAEVISNASFISLGANKAINLQVIFNSNSFSAGGDYLGPMAPAPITTFNPGQLTTPSTVGMEWKQQGKVNYHVSVTNDSNAPASLSIDCFVND